MIFWLNFRSRKSVYSNTAYCPSSDNFFFVNKRHTIARVNLSPLQNWELGNRNCLCFNQSITQRFRLSRNNTKAPSNSSWLLAKRSLDIGNNASKVLNNLLPFDRNRQLCNVNVSINFTPLIGVILQNRRRNQACSKRIRLNFIVDVLLFNPNL